MHRPSGGIKNTPGCPASAIYGDTWEWTPSTTVVGQGTWSQIGSCGGPGQPTCSASSAPTPRYAAGIADVPATRVVLFGGCGATNCPLGDTWAFTANVWTKLTPSTAPSPRYAESMVYDLPDSIVLLFGGCGSSAVGCTGAGLYGDTWELSSSGVWSQQGSCGGPGQLSCAPGSAPTDRYFALISCPRTTYYPVLSDEVSLFGGTTGAVTSFVLNDYWLFSAGAWTHVTPPWGYTPYPNPRFDGDWLSEYVTTDSLSMFGGTSPSGSSLGDMESLLLLSRPLQFARVAPLCPFPQSFVCARHTTRVFQRS